MLVPTTLRCLCSYPTLAISVPVPPQIKRLPGTLPITLTSGCHRTEQSTEKSPNASASQRRAGCAPAAPCTRLCTGTSTHRNAVEAGAALGRLPVLWRSHTRLCCTAKGFFFSFFGVGLRSGCPRDLLSFPSLGAGKVSAGAGREGLAGCAPGSG